MTDQTYKKAKEIQEKLKELNTLYYIACQPCKTYFLTKTFLWVTIYDKDEACLCDEGLTEVIREYCDKKIKELREELESL